MKADEVGRHFGAARVVFVTSQKLDVLALFRREERENFVDGVLFDLFENVDAVVGRHFLEEFGDFFARARFDNFNLQVFVEVTEDFGAERRVDFEKNRPNFARFQRAKKLRRRGRVERRTKNAHFLRVVRRDHLAKFREQQGIGGTHRRVSGGFGRGGRSVKVDDGRRRTRSPVASNAC